ncbi:MAG: hypothetical protein KF842_07710 [Caulobacter sp.]|nr:hypothetical protein [Caulobacter sp.]
MKTLMITALVLTAATSTAVAAQPAARLTDSQFVKAARCKGLAKSEALGAMDTTGVDAVIKANKRGRSTHILDKAYNAQDEAQSEADRADDAAKADLIAERTGACEAFGL